MRFDQALVAGHGEEAVAHAIVPRCRKVGSLQVRQQEGLSARIPCAIANAHCI